MSVKEIRKRDGRVVPFEKEKVTDAIFKAAQVVGGKDREIAERLAGEVVTILDERYVGTTPCVEDIQDVVKKVLMEHGHAKTAKAYILYRKQKEELRKLRGEHPKEITFVVKTDQDEADLFELLYKHNIKFEPVQQQPDTYELKMSEMTAAGE